MKHTLDAIILAKRELRKELAALPFEQKWVMTKNASLKREHCQAEHAPTIA